MTQQTAGRFLLGGILAVREVAEGGTTPSGRRGLGGPGLRSSKGELWTLEPEHPHPGPSGRSVDLTFYDDCWVLDEERRRRMRSAYAAMQARGECGRCGVFASVEAAMRFRDAFYPGRADIVWLAYGLSERDAAWYCRVYDAAVGHGKSDEYVHLQRRLAVPEGWHDLGYEWLDAHALYFDSWHEFDRAPMGLCARVGGRLTPAGLWRTDEDPVVPEVAYDAIYDVVSHGDWFPWRVFQCL